MNATSNASFNSTVLYANNQTELITYIVLEIAIAVFALFGNSLVLISIWKFRSLRTPTNWLVASLAVADIAVAIIAIPSAILLRLGLSVTHEDCPYVTTGPSVGEMTCLLIITSVIFLTQVSIFSLTVIAIDRFIAINYPFKYQSMVRSKKWIKSSTAVVWISGALIGLVPQLGWNKWVHGNTVPCDRRRCEFEEVTSMEYMVYFNFFGCVLLPLIVMGVLYIFIFRSAKKQLRKIYFDVKKLKTRSRSMEILQYLKISKSESPKSVRQKRTFKSNSVRCPEMSIDGTKGTTPLNGTHVMECSDKCIAMQGCSLSDLSTPQRVSLEYANGSQTSFYRRSHFSVSEGDICSHAKNQKEDASREKSFSSITPSYTVYPKSTPCKAAIMNKQRQHMTDEIANSAHSSQSTVYASEFAADGTIQKVKSRDTRNNELCRKMKRKRQLLKKEFRAARSLATVVGVFAFCWLPLHIMNVLTLHCPSCVQPLWLKDLAILLSHANSMINPFIYAFSMRDFRKAFRKLLSCWFMPTHESCFAGCCTSSTLSEDGSPESSFEGRNKDDLKQNGDKCTNNNYNNATKMANSVIISKKSPASSADSIRHQYIGPPTFLATSSTALLDKSLIVAGSKVCEEISDINSTNILLLSRETNV